ncbi:MAG: transcription termination factor NusA [Holosporales bacterium]|nr:transcription termination factor NusA [Holosporales bacterium]
MSRKIKAETKVHEVAFKNEILQIADIVARDKGIDREEILGAMECAILKTAQMKYGEERELKVVIDRKTGEIEIYRTLKVVERVKDGNTEISELDALRLNSEARIGDEINDQLPAIDFGRIGAQVARQIIVQKVKVAERKKQYEEFEGRVGEIITGIVRRIEFSDVMIDIGRTEGVIRKSELIPNEVFKVGDRIKILLSGLNKDHSGPLLHLSRTSPNFLRKLFEQEVPEIYDGIIKIVSIARDPGSKAKIAVATSDPNLDPIGACVGTKGSRVQAVVDELKGERVDIVQWSDNPAIFIVNSLSPAEVSRIVMEESGNKVEAVVPDDQLSAAIGRRGQNVRLASKLTGWTISVTTEKEDSETRARESARILGVFMENLDVDDMVARLLMGEGFSSIEDLVNASISELASIDGFDEGIATEIHQRAVVSMEKKKADVERLCSEKGVSKELMEYKLLRLDLLELLAKADIKTLEDLGSLSADELLDITGDLLTKHESETLIMKVREGWF